MKKGIKYIIIVLLLLLTIFLYPKIKIHFAISELTTYNYDKRLRITYLMIDKEKTKDKDITVKNALYQDATISLIQNGIAYLNKEGNYYVGYINDVNNYILKDVPDYSFTYNNLDGEVIDGCIFDLKTRKIKIPVKYYENPKKEENVQMEIISRVDKEKFSSLKSNLKVYGLKNYEKKFTLNANETTSLISIIDYNSKNSISKDEISIYVNGDAEKLDSLFYEWNHDAGTIELRLSPVLINNVTVTIDSNFISYNLLGRAANAETEKYEKMDVAGKLTGEPNLNVGSTIKLNVGVAYKSNGTIYGSSNAVSNYESASVDNDLYNSCNTNDKTCNKYVDHTDYFVLDLSDKVISQTTSSNGTTTTIKVKPNTYVKAYCGAHVNELNSKANDTFDINFTVVAINKSDNYAIFSITPVNTDDNYFTQQPAGVIKVVWKDSYGKIKIKKKLVDQGVETTVPADAFGVTLYSDNNCTQKKRKEKTFGTDNLVEYTNLALGNQYYVSETKCDEHNYLCDDECYGLTLSKKDELLIDTTYYNNPITNYVKYYCTKVKKVDTEYSSCKISNVNFHLSNNTTVATGLDGIATFSNLKYGSYTVSETDDGIEPKDTYCSNDKKSFVYYNDNITAHTVPLSLMTWDSSNEKYSGCPSNALELTRSNHKAYYCLKVKKVDANDNTKALSGATFTATKGKTTISETTGPDGIATFYLGDIYGDWTVTETTAPAGYAVASEQKIITATKMSSKTRNDTKKDSAYCGADATAYVYEDDKLLLNWYKEAESNSKKISGAKFKVKLGDNYVMVDGTATQKDSTGAEKTCYVWKGTTASSSSASELVADSEGHVCISGVPEGTYTVEETQPAAYHTFSQSKTKNISTSTTFATSSNANTFVNKPTRFEFTKEVEGQTTAEQKTTAQTTLVDWNGAKKSVYDITTDELKNLTFEVYKYDKDGKLTSTPLSFKLVNGIYEYTGNSIDAPTTGDAVTQLRLNDSRKIIIQHLEIGSYAIKEINEDGSTCNESSGHCTGYYYPNYTNESTYKFTITTCSNADATSCSESGVATKSLTNVPTEITFTKEDFYHGSTGNSETFEDTSKVLAFDRIRFSLKLKDSNNTLMRFIKVSDGVYRYVRDASVTDTVSELYTNNGKLTITNLCRGKTYILTEEEVPADSVFALIPEENVTTKTYSIPCVEDSSTNNQTKSIENKPTRYEIEKKDSYLGGDINVELGAKFTLYKCNDTAGGDCDTEIKFKKITINKDNDQDNGKEVYAYSPAIDTGDEISELSLINGGLIFRYLPLGTYKLIETNAPRGFYTLSDNKITFTVTSNTLQGHSDFWNTPTQIRFQKKDIYQYYDAKFNDAEAAVFDSMKFKLRNSAGEIQRLRCVRIGDADYDSSTKTCKSGVYRLIKFNVNDEDSNYSMEELNTVNGEFIITNLNRDSTYYIEETKADSTGHFILPTTEKYEGITWNNGHPVVTYKIGKMAEAHGSIQNTTQVVPDSLTEIIENKPTRVYFKKVYIKDDGTKEIIKDEDNPVPAGKTTFQIYKCTMVNNTCEKGALIKFNERAEIKNDKEDPGKEVYKYAKDQNATGLVTDLHTYYGELIIRYLPKGNYVLVETNSPDGYFNPIDPNTYFEVKGVSANDSQDYELTEEVSNKPTKLIFNKEDLYSYYNSDDVASVSDNTKLFDTMRFRLRDENGNILSLKCTTKNGKGYNKKKKMCESGEYRYLPITEDNNLTELNTINGTFTITHLYKNKVYYIEEIKTDDEGVFILPDYMNFDGINWNEGHPVVKYTLPLTEPTDYKSVTDVIKNTPTRIRIEKRDSKYNYLIPDETTTFNVYRCKDVEKCTKELGELVYFTERAVIAGDKEDPGVEVYKYSKLNAKAVSDLHPHKGVLVLRYLPSTYSYVIVETVAPKNYSLPTGSDTETQFTIASNTVDTNIVDVPNKPTSLIIKKYADDDSTLLAGAEFKIYEGTKCDGSLSAMNQSKKLLKLKTIRDGVYEYRPNADTDTIKTCEDKEGALCSDIETELTYEKYKNTFADFNTSLNEENEKVSIVQGEALVQYLEYGHCYIIEEVKAPKGYSLPEKDEDRFTMVQIPENTTYTVDTYKTFINKPTPFTFYKFDEYNQLLDGAEFKLQKLNDDKKYEDVTVTKEETEAGVFYKVDSTTDNITITTVNGSATVYYLEEGQYRIVETKAAEGKELNKNPNIATFFVDENGKVYGNSIIVNKAKTEKIELKSSASAELVVAVRTGVTVVRYGLIISVITGVIIALMVLLKIKKNKSE